MFKKSMILLAAVAFAFVATGCNAVSIVGDSLNLAGTIVSLFG